MKKRHVQIGNMKTREGEFLKIGKGRRHNWAVTSVCPGFIAYKMKQFNS